jgi:hypothetical protein
MSKETKQGRTIVLLIIGVFIAMELYTFVRSDVIRGSDIVRLTLTLILSFFIYKGFLVARWIAVALFGMLGLLGILSVLEVATMLMSAEGFMLIFITMIDAISAYLLARSRSVKAFLNYQRKRMQQGIPSELQQADVQ